MVGINKVDGETIYIASATNFIDVIKQAYLQDKMILEIFKDLGEHTRKN